MGVWSSIYGRGNSGGGGDKPDIEQWQKDLLNQLRPLQDNKTLYYRAGSETNPQEGDRRDTGNGIGRNGDEVFLNGKWVKKIDVGSVGTDMITLRDGLNDIKVKEKDRTFNLIRKLKTMLGIQFGSSFSPMALTSASEEDSKIYYPNKLLECVEITPRGENVMRMPQMLEQLVWYQPDAIVESVTLEAKKESRARMRIYKHDYEGDLQLTDENLIYESMPDSEFKNPENIECYGGATIPKGVNRITLRNELYFTCGSTYDIILETMPGVVCELLGDTRIYLEFNFYAEESKTIATRDWAKTNAVPVLLDEYNLEHGQVGVIAQTMPKTYNASVDKDFVTAAGLDFLTTFFAKFKIQGCEERSVILASDRYDISIEPQGPGKVVFFIFFYGAMDGTRRSIIIDTSVVTKGEENIVCPMNPYVPNWDEYWKEVEKQWSIRANVVNDEIAVEVVDPIGGHWVVREKDAHHIGMGGNYVIGRNPETGYCLQELSDRCFTTISAKGDEQFFDEIIRGLSQARLVTRYKKDIVDILDPIAIHKYAAKTTDFHTMFTTSGLYRCVDMESNLPPGCRIRDNDVYADVYNNPLVPECVMLRATDSRSGQDFIKIQERGEWGEWFSPTDKCPKYKIIEAHTPSAAEPWRSSTVSHGLDSSRIIGSTAFVYPIEGNDGFRIPPAYLFAADQPTHGYYYNYCLDGPFFYISLKTDDCSEIMDKRIMITVLYV